MTVSHVFYLIQGVTATHRPEDRSYWTASIALTPEEAVQRLAVLNEQAEAFVVWRAAYARTHPLPLPQGDSLGERVGRRYRAAHDAWMHQLHTDVIAYCRSTSMLDPWPFPGGPWDVRPNYHIEEVTDDGSHRRQRFDFYAHVHAHPEQTPVVTPDADYQCTDCGAMGQHYCGGRPDDFGDTDDAQ